MNAARAREVTADGMTRVTAVVAELVELDRTEPTGHAAGEAPLNDLIAKAAQVVARHASVIRGMRSRGLEQQGRSRESLRVAGSGADAVEPHRLDFVG